jgi:hypothetical protein
MGGQRTAAVSIFLKDSTGAIQTVVMLQYLFSIENQV